MKKITSTLSALLLAANLFTLPALPDSRRPCWRLDRQVFLFCLLVERYRLIMSQSIAFLWTSVKMATRYPGRLNATSCPVIPQR